jgi:hypothetical protein
MTTVFHPASIRNAGTAASASSSKHGSSIGRPNSSSSSSSSSSLSAAALSIAAQSASVASRASSPHVSHLSSSLTQAVRAHVECSGYLLKQGSSSYSTFRKRWFELTDGKLLYFETRQATFELGLIDLVNVTLVDAGSSTEASAAPGGAAGGAGNGNNGSNSTIPVVSAGSYKDDVDDLPTTSAANMTNESYRFRVETPKRVYQFVAASEAEMWHWISCLRMARLVVQERDLARDALRRQIDVGRRARDDVAAAVALLEHEHAAHSEARRRLTELTERNEQLREWNERVTTQLELSELELARMRSKLEAALRYVVAYEQAKLAGAELVRRLDNKEKQLEALKAQLLAVTQAAGIAAAAEPSDGDLSVSTEALLWSMSNLDVGERTIAELRSEIRRQSELEASASGATGSGRARSSAIVDHMAAQATPAAASSAATSATSAAAAAASTSMAASDKGRVIPLEEADKCSLCDSKFTLLRWKRRCPGCQAVCCSDCLPHTVTIRSGSEFKNARVCDNCFHRALERKVHQPQ